ncbi:MAG TPA: adenylate/guanylate cyclase domain-containing protein [Chloroflexota bacterium]|nr:adenylate/guanylate cyclase domain-containing protein [Chloroflexota bacterium]
MTDSSHPCPSCAAPVDDSMAFCPSCGARQPETVRDLTPSDIRLATVLFGDVVGFTALSENRSPEEVTEVMNRCFEVLSEPIVRYGGTIDKYVGDAIMARFGAPRAHEDDAVRAVAAALDMQHAMAEFDAELRRDGGPGLAMRIGINTGEVLAGEVGSSALRQFTLMGNTVNLASRLEHEAEPGSILVGETTYRIAQRAFTFRAMPPMEIRGQSGLVHAFVPLGRRSAQSPGDDKRSEFVGRGDELAELERGLREAEAGRGSVVQIVGEPGVGKTRLVGEFIAAQPDDAVTWVRAGASAFGHGVPYGLLSSVVRRLLAIDETARELDRTVLRDRLLTVLPEASVNDAVAVVAEILAVDVSGSYSISLTDSRVRRAMLVNVLRTVLAAQSEQRVTGLVIDDMHWADGASLEVLGRLLRGMEDSRILFLATSRPGFEPDWEGVTTRTIALHDLSPARAGDLVSSILGETKVSDNLTQWVLKRAGGNPYFLEQILTTLVESGVIIRPRGGWEFATGVDISRVPETLQGVVQARIDQLQMGARLVLEAAAVIGTEVPRDTLGAVVDNATDLDSALAALLGHQFLVQSAGDHGYEFKHALTRDVVYRGILASRRRALHRRVATALEINPDPSIEVLSLLTMHHLEAGNREKALNYAIAAGDRARSLYANEDAARYYQRATDLLADRPSDDPGPLASVTESLGDVLGVLADYPRARARYQQAAELATEPRDRARLWRKIGDLGRAAGRYTDAAVGYRRAEEALSGHDDATEHAAIWLARAAMDRSRGALESAWSAYVQILAHVRELDETSQADLFFELGMIERERAHMKGAVGYLETAAEFWAQAGDIDKQARVAVALADVAYHSGDLRGSAELLERALDLRRRMLDRHGVAVVLLALARVKRTTGELPEALDLIDQASGIAADSDDMLLKAEAQLEVGLLHLETHDATAAGREILEAYRMFKQMRNWRGLAQALLARVAVLRDTGEVDQARAALGAALDLVVEMRDPFLTAEARIAEAQLGDHGTDGGRVSRLRETAIRVARQTGDPRLVALAEGTADVGRT